MPKTSYIYDYECICIRPILGGLSRWVVWEVDKRNGWYFEQELRWHPMMSAYCNSFRYIE